MNIDKSVFLHKDVPCNTAAKFSTKLLEEGLLVTVEDASGSRLTMYAFEPLVKLVRIYF